MRTNQTLVIDGDTIKAMYIEGACVDIRDVGVIDVAKKVSDIRFNSKRQLWEAIDRKTRRVVASDASRVGCVRKEHAYYEARIISGKYPWK